MAMYGQVWRGRGVREEDHLLDACWRTIEHVRAHSSAHRSRLKRSAAAFRPPPCGHHGPQPHHLHSAPVIGRSAASLKSLEVSAQDYAAKSALAFAYDVERGHDRPEWRTLRCERFETESCPAAVVIGFDYARDEWCVLVHERLLRP